MTRPKIFLLCFLGITALAFALMRPAITPTPSQVQPSAAPTSERILLKYVRSDSTLNPQMPSISHSSTEDRARAAALLNKKRNSSEQTDLINFYASAASDLRALIERHATERDQELRTALISICVKSLAAENERVKMVSLESLRHMNVSDGKAYALNLLRGEPLVAEQAIMYLGRINANEAFEPVHEIALTSTSIETKAIAIRNLVLVGGKRHPDKVMVVLEPALSDPSRKIRMEALRILPRFAGSVSNGLRARVKDLAQAATTGKRDEAQEKMEAEAALLTIDTLVNAQKDEHSLNH
jgi:hypothetical protein